MNPMVALSIGQSVAGFIDARNKANAAEARYLQNRQASIQARDLKIQGLQQRAFQQAELTAEQKLQLAVKALETRESKKTAGGESGLSGQTERLKVDATTARELRGRDALKTQLNYTLSQIELEKAGVNSEALNRINSLPRGQQPSLAAALISGASNAIAADITYAKGATFGFGTPEVLAAEGLVGDATTNLTPVPTEFSINVPQN